MATPTTVRRLAGDLLRLEWDVARGLAELSSLPLLWPTLRTVLPDGRGRGVLAIPGYLADDRSLEPLVATLRSANFDAVSWGLGRNGGGGSEPLAQTLRGVAAKLRPVVDDLVRRTDGPVALVGQSLGGTYARWLAERLGDRIDRVITLGAPTLTAGELRGHNQVIVKLSEALSGRTLAQRVVGGSFGPWGPEEPPIPLVSIYSPFDGVVGPTAAAVPASHLHSTAPVRENICVLSSHTGMAGHAGVLYALANRLVQPVDRWRAFDPTYHLPPVLRGLGLLLFPADAGVAG